MHSRQRDLSQLTPYWKHVHAQADNPPQTYCTMPQSADGNRMSTTGPRHPDRHVDQAPTGANVGQENQIRTACYNCRSLRQRCDRRIPCSRCTAQSRQCRYPLKTNRGKKTPKNSRSKIALVEDLLSRLGEDSVREQIVSSLLNSDLASLEREALSSDASPEQTHNQHAAKHWERKSDTNHGSSEYELHSLVSPLDVMAAAVTASTETQPISHQHNALFSFSDQLNRTTITTVVDERLSSYFAPQTTCQRDWQILNSQPVGGTLKLDPAACDPLTARIIDQHDAANYFELFFKFRNPLLGILDPILHTPNYVYSRSFTLFSTICALGCAMSGQTRDRVLYPILLDLAEADIKWSIAFSVKSIETIQVIMNKQYWAPLGRRQSDDPSWLRLSHAVQIAREMGIHKPAVVAAQVNAIASTEDSPSFKERLARNFERMWLYTFMADKGFGLTTGRHMGVSWREVPASAPEWWRKPMTTPLDRLICGSMEMRGILINALSERKYRENRTIASIHEWHGRNFTLLEHLRSTRCVSEDPIIARCHSVLEFYIDHGVMILNAEALRDLLAIDESGASTETTTVTKTSVNTASHLLDLILTNATLEELLIGFHNNQYIMICHAATELLHALKRGVLSEAESLEVAARVKAIPERLERTARELPDSSTVHLYLSLARFFASQVDGIVNASSDFPNSDNLNSNYPLADWWRVLELGPLDPASRFDMGFHELERLDFTLPNMNNMGFFD